MATEETKGAPLGAHRVEDRAMRSILRRSRASGRAETKTPGKGDKATIAERRADVDQALGWLKKEMAAMREDDKHLIRELVTINKNINKIKQRQLKDDWSYLSDSADDSDGDIVAVAAAGGVDGDGDGDGVRPRLSTWSQGASRKEYAVSPLVKPKARAKRRVSSDGAVAAAAAWLVKSPESGKNLAPPPHLSDSIRAAETSTIQEEDDYEETEGKSMSLGRKVERRSYPTMSSWQ